MGGGLFLILLVYGVGAATIAAHQAIWSPDCGARLVQIQSILQHWPHWWVSYPAQALDPQHQNSPLYFFEFRHGEHIYVFYSFLFALISAFCFGHFGYGGLAILSVAGGAATALATYGLARLLHIRYPLAPMLLVALITPLVIYSIVFWDHSLTTGIAAICLYLGLRAVTTGRVWLWLVAGLALGGGLWFHEILIPCLPALLAGLWWARRRTPWLLSSALLIAGVAVLVVPLALINKSVYGTYMGPHLSNNRLGSSGAILDFLKNPREWGLGAVYTLFGWGNTNPGFTWELRDWVAHPWPRFQSEMHASMWMAGPVIGWSVLALTGLWRRGWGGVMATLLLFAGMTLSARFVNSHDDWPHSLFLACPFLLLAFAAAPSRIVPSTPSADNARSAEDAAETGLLWQVIVVFTIVYTLFDLLKPTLGGTEWGSRHLLVTVPALTLLAWRAVESLLPIEGLAATPVDWQPQEMTILGGIPVLLVMSLSLQWHGFTVINNMHEENHQVALAIERAPDKVVVSSIWWAAMNAAPAYMNKQILYAGDPSHPATPLFAQMRAAGIKSYTLVGTAPDELSFFSGPFGYRPIPNTVQATSLNLRLNRYQIGYQ